MFVLNFFHSSLHKNRGADEKAEERVVTADVENLKWKTVVQPKPEKPDASLKNIEFSTLLPELTPHARYAVFTREVVSKGEAKTSEIHYVQVSPGSRSNTHTNFFSNSIPAPVVIVGLF